MRRIVTGSCVLVVLLTAVGTFYLRTELNRKYPEQAGPGIIEIPRGLPARDVVRLLESKNVIQNQYVVLAYIIYSGARHKLRAGEYLFDQPMTPIEVVTKIVSGNVYLHKFTVPEGHTLQDTARKWQEQGFGAAEDFEEAAQSLATRIHDIDPEATTVEGYLFPETYSFPAHSSARQAVEAMVNRFRAMLRRLEGEVPKENWPLDIRRTVILASLVESEAAKEDERPLVASVYLNRIMRRILLQCDPTVIYALERADRYHGRLTLTDLKFPSPYNTYVNPGLPPGPIMNPGYPSLKAAVQPASTTYLYFVRTIDDRHTFSDSLAAHNRAVAVYRKIQGRSR